MDDWAIDYEWQLRLGPYVYDFRLPGQVLVEVQGGYWHPDPKRCDPAAMPGEQWERLLRDMAKSRYASQRGYRLITVWERDLRAGRVTRESLAAGAALPGGSKGP
jgi:G:T-mismatch repair DNA endonuclease (very short patch repair protein)